MAEEGKISDSNSNIKIEEGTFGDYNKVLNDQFTIKAQ